MTEDSPLPASPKQPGWLLIVRFGMEIVAFGGLAWWGWSIAGGGITGFALGAVFLVVAALLWGVFAVPNDPSRNPDPPIGVPEWLRLIIEFGIFGIAAYGIWVSGARWLSETLLTLVGVTYVITHDRAAWLLQQRCFRGLKEKVT